MNKLDELSAEFVMDYVLGNKYITDPEFYSSCIQEYLDEYDPDNKHGISLEHHMEWSICDWFEPCWMSKQPNGEWHHAYDLHAWDPEYNPNWSPSWDDKQLQTVIKKMCKDGFMCFLTITEDSTLCVFSDGPVDLKTGVTSKDFNEAVLIAAIRAKGGEYVQEQES